MEQLKQSVEKVLKSNKQNIIMSKSLIESLKDPVVREPLMVDFNQSLYDAIINQFDEKRRQLKVLIDMFMNLSIGDFDQSTYDRMLKEGPIFIKEKFERSLNNQVKSINNSIIRQNLLKNSGLDSLLKEFNIAYSEFKSTNHSQLFQNMINGYGISGFLLPLDLITIKDNKPFLLEGAHNTIKNTYCSVIIDSPEKWELYDALMTIKNAYEKRLLPVFEKNNFIHGNYLGFGTLRANFFYDKDDFSLGIDWSNFTWCLSHRKT